VTPISPEQYTFSVPLECRYLLHVPDPLPAKPLVAITLHGYGSGPEAMLRLTTGLIGDQAVVAAIQGPNQHYANPGLPEARSSPAYNWGIRPHWESSVRLHHAMLLEVFDALRKRFQVGPERCLLAGFSQPVGLNYRFIASHPEQAAGVIGVCGGVPRDWHEAKYQRVTAAILHISRDQDEFYPAAVASTFPDRLRERAGDVEFHLIPGPHRFPSKASGIVQPWLERVYGG
jgi:predicted esterase